MNGILLINKPKGWTSFDVVNYLNKKFRLKVGHTGTLDPQATGVLVCLVGVTKALPFLVHSTKRYVASVKLGIKTSTGDVWGEVIQEQTVVPYENLAEIIQSFVGVQTQRVPMTSAKKVKGKKLMEYQRQNIPIETQYQEIEIKEIELLNSSLDSFEFKAHVSSGTYIRSLCEDIAGLTQNLGAMSSLIRTEVGNFKLEQCKELNDVTLSDLIPIERGLVHIPKVEVEDVNFVYHGKPLYIDFQGDIIGLYYQDRILAIYKYDHQNKIYKSQRGLWT